MKNKARPGSQYLGGQKVKYQGAVEKYLIGLTHSKDTKVYAFGMRYCIYIYALFYMKFAT